MQIHNLIPRGYDAYSYVKNLRNYRSLVRQLMSEAKPPAEHVAAITDLIAKIPQPVQATMMTEDWCGDSALNTPILTTLFRDAKVEFRVFRGSEERQLKRYYEEDGATHIPVVSLWDGEGREIVRWIEAPAAVQKRKDAWKAERPEFMELYRRQGEDREAARRFQELYREFMETMVTWYRDEGLWSETTGEILRNLSSAVDH